MAMTLKIASHDHRPGDARTVSWIGGVTEIHRIGQAHASERLAKWETYYHSDGIRDLGSPDPGDEERSDSWLTLLSVKQEGATEFFYVIVQTAWLLAQNGDTIERVAP
jgi:hypothetical protein